jgi:hypothetical protein
VTDEKSPNFQLVDDSAEGLVNNIAGYLLTDRKSRYKARTKRQASSTLAVECLRKTGHEGNALNASFDPRRSSASASG